MSRLDYYATKDSSIKMSRRDGILEMRFHTDYGPLCWGLGPHGEPPEAVLEQLVLYFALLPTYGQKTLGRRACHGICQAI